MNFSLGTPPGEGPPPAPSPGSMPEPDLDLPPAPAPAARRRSHGRRIVAFAVIGLVILAGVLLTQVPGSSKMVRGLMFSSADTGVMTVKANRGRLPVSFTERGSLESSENLDVFSQVEGTTTIISIKPEGTRVTKGELVCELDSSALSDNLVNQEIQTQQADASHKNAELTLEVAKIAVIEYVEGTYKQEEETAKGNRLESYRISNLPPSELPKNYFTYLRDARRRGRPDRQARRQRDAPPGPHRLVAALRGKRRRGRYDCRCTRICRRAGIPQRRLFDD